MLAVRLGRSAVRPLIAILVIAVGLGACNGAAASPRTSPLPRTVGSIDHRTGAADVILRLERGGGFVPIGFLASQAPTFTLFGNGVIVFQRKLETFPRPDASGVTHNVPWRTTSLDEAQIQDLLAFAIGPGGLATARDSYVVTNVADAPDTIFTIRAGGLDKTVVVNALSEASGQVPDGAARAAFLALAERLRDIDRGGTIDSVAYMAGTYRGILLERESSEVSPLAWPWPAIQPTDFRADPSGVGRALPHRSMTIDEVAALGIKDVTGGLQDVVLRGPDGKIYSLTLRPLLADETE